MDNFNYEFCNTTILYLEEKSNKKSEMLLKTDSALDEYEIIRLKEEISDSKQLEIKTEMKECKRAILELKNMYDNHSKKKNELAAHYNYIKRQLNESKQRMLQLLGDEENSDKKENGDDEKHSISFLCDVQITRYESLTIGRFDKLYSNKLYQVCKTCFRILLDIEKYQDRFENLQDKLII